MKRKLLFRRFFSSLLLLVVSTLSWASSLKFKVDGIYYQTYDYDYVHYVYVTYATKDYNSYSGSVVIPSVVSYGDYDYDVKGIGQEAFYKCTDLTSVIIPESVTSIGHRAFCRCSSLPSIVIPESVTNIGNFAFYACENLISISIPNSVTNIGDFAFSKCPNLNSVTFPVGEVDIAGTIFSDCASLPVEDNIRYADKYLVEAVDKTLSTYTIREGVKYIGASAFSGCSNLNSISIPESVTEIGSGAFFNCPNLPVEGNVRYADTYLVGAVDKTQNTYMIKEGTRIIAAQAFHSCPNLKSIAIPNSVISIGDEAFVNCPNFKTIVINSNTIASKKRSSQESLHSLFADIFRSNLEECVFGEEVKEIGSYCLYNNYGVESKLSSIIFLGNVSSIGAGAFQNNDKIVQINLPQSMTNIESYAFDGCGLTSITCLAEKVPNTGNYAIPSGPQGKAILYVPAASVDKYKAAGEWKYFGTVLPIDPTGIDDARGNVKPQQQADGKYTMNGKIYIVKNGLKYNIDGTLSNTEN